MFYKFQNYSKSVQLTLYLFQFPLHKDCCNSVSIHPFRPILATGSGQYHFNDPITLLCEEISMEDSQTVQKANDDFQPTSEIDNTMEISVIDENVTDNTVGDEDVKYSSKSENSLVFWWTGDVKELIENQQDSNI